MVHPQQAFLDKKEFPQLLASALTEMDRKSPNAIKKDLISSFEATGIEPLNAERVLQKILLEAASTRKNIKRQRLNVEPGESVTAANNDEDYSDYEYRNI
ncbi:hypothetical protein FQA39_LY10581 [Lamprigera yunnana]|nr:hypothetical protein FQA39_LY10581 [Lamprigera yunnana]